MKLFRGIFLLALISVSHIYAREILKDIIPENGVGAEIGVWKGDFSRFLWNNTHPQKLHLIDPWVFRDDYPWAMYGGVIAKSQEEMDKIYNQVIKTFSSYSEVEIHRMSSVLASELFPEDYFDWIYIDGDHTYIGVMDDLTSYYSKVKKGGLIIGDDYSWKSVKAAFHDFCKNNEITNYKIFDSQFVIWK